MLPRLQSLCYVCLVLVAPGLESTGLAAKPLRREKLTRNWGIHSNPSILRRDSRASKPTRFYLVPLKLVKIDAMPGGFSERAKKEFLTTKGGELFFRWPVHPRDQGDGAHHLRVARFLKQHGYSTKLHTDTKWQQSESRSLFPQAKRLAISPKVGATDLLGPWSGRRRGGIEVGGAELLFKGWDASDARWSLAVSQHVKRQLKQYKSQYTLVLPEVLSAHLGEEGNSWGAMSVRDLRLLRTDAYHYLPAQSALHERTSRLIALVNGSLDPIAFWQEPIGGGTGRAVTETFLASQMMQASAHLQNELAELDPLLRPTGRRFVSTILRQCAGINRHGVADESSVHRKE